MRNVVRTSVAAAAFASIGLLATPAGATILSGPEGLRSAIQQAGDATEPVHCRPGFWHHRFRPHNGCYGGYGYRPYAYYGGPRVYFGVGPRRHWGGWRRHW
jgi:hypothetical protein